MEVRTTPRNRARNPRRGLGGRILLSWIALVLVVAGAARAQSNRGAFAEFDASARETAWGAAGVVLSEHAESGRINPAGLLALPGREVSVSYADLFALGLVTQTQLHAGWAIARTSLEHEGPEIRRRRLPPPARFAFGLSLTQLRGEAGGIGPSRSSGIYRESAMGLTLAWPTFGGAAAGAHFRLLTVDSDFETVGASGTSIGLGILRDVGRFRIGVTGDNLLGSLDWDAGEDEPLPRRYRAGLGWTGSGGRLRIGVGFSVLGEEGKGRTVGASADWRPYQAFALRGGCAQVEDVAGSEIEPSAGLGFSWQGVTIDWGFRANGRDLGTTHRWSASVAL